MVKYTRPIPPTGRIKSEVIAAQRAAADASRGRRTDLRTQYGTIDPLWTTGLAPVTLGDGSHINASVPPNDPDFKPGASVAVEQVGPSSWIAVAAYGVPAFPKWIDLTLATGWTQAGLLSAGTQSNGGNPDAPYHKVQVTKTAGNYVDVAGTVVQAAGATTLVTTLPVGFRPLVDQQFVIRTIVSGSSGSTGVTVKTDGTVTLQGTGSVGDIFSLDGINFTNDASLVWTTFSSLGYLNNWADTGGTKPVGAITVDSNFRVWLRGVLKRTSGGAGANQMVATFGTTFRPPASGSIILRGVDPGVRVTTFYIASTGALSDPNGGFTDTALDISSCWLSVNSPTSYTVPTYLVGSDYASGFYGHAYTKTADGVVMMRGVVSSSTGGKSTAALPIGYRPSGVRRFPISTNGTLGSYLIWPDGSVYFESGAAYEELNQIRFVAEQ